MDGSNASEERWDRHLTEFYKDLDQKLVDRNKSNMMTNVGYIKNLKLQDLFYFLLGEGTVPVGNQRTYLKGGPGVYALMSPMLNVPDKEYYVTPPQIWNLENYIQIKRGGHQSLGFLNEVTSIESFAEQAIILSTHSKKFVKKRFLSPLSKYVSCLNAPRNLKKKTRYKYQKGRRLFRQYCKKCHQGKNGEGLPLHLPEAVNSPNVYFNMLKDLKIDDMQSKNIMNIFDQLNIIINVPHGLAPRRLNGIWAKERLMHNGQILGLDHLFCLNGKERSDFDRDNPLLDGIHYDLCQDYNQLEKESLKEYLEHFKTKGSDHDE